MSCRQTEKESVSLAEAGSVRSTLVPDIEPRPRTTLPPRGPTGTGFVEPAPLVLLRLPWNKNQANDMQMTHVS